ncbi:hypothetical protein A9Q96_09995 [Rhodobacterales bacterium 52_120_T64]|nr:hypothetical protein A9Q96_09995 [Rhodobacterales bacterium 52_120_T64]
MIYSRNKTSLICAGLLIVIVGFYALATVRITLNGSSSLPHNGYLMVTWPKVLWHGAYVAIKPPSAFKEIFEGVYFVKEVRGLDGDIIRHGPGDKVCVSNACYALLENRADILREPVDAGEIPQGKFAAFGTAPDSLDSRYSVVGLFARENVVAVGVPLRIPHWKEIKAWIGS